MAMLPESARTAASYLGGGIAKAMKQQGGKVASAGAELAGAANAGKIGQKVGNFLESVGTQVQQAGATAGMKGGLKKRDIGLVAAGVGMTGAFVGGMGANAGVNALMGHFGTQQKYEQSAQDATYGGNVLPSNLQTGYIRLNEYGSPLGLMNVGNYSNVKTAQMRQRLLSAAMGPEFNGTGGEG